MEEFYTFISSVPVACLHKTWHTVHIHTKERGGGNGVDYTLFCPHDRVVSFDQCSVFIFFFFFILIRALVECSGTLIFTPSHKYSHGHAYLNLFPLFFLAYTKASAVFQQPRAGLGSGSGGEGHGGPVRKGGAGEGMAQGVHKKKELLAL